MPRHFEREIESLRKTLLTLSAAVDEAVHKALLSIRRRDVNLAREVIAGDKDIDLMEVEVEEECLKVLALYQPVANDLRYIVGVLKMNDELERIGDLAVNIAKRAEHIAGLVPVPIPFDFDTMTERTLWMLQASIQALVNLDTDLARQVWFADEEVDEIHRAAYDGVKDAIRADISGLDSLVSMLTLARFVERIADQATNIAKDVLYMIEGEIVRHRSQEFRELREAPE
jgi:phosphate transport system protein